MKRAVIIAHNHPAVQPGGAEIAAFDLARTLPSQGVETLWLSSTAGPPAADVLTVTSEGRPDRPSKEVQFCGADYDSFWHRHNQVEHLTGPFLKVIEEWQPDVIHWQHFFRIGVEGMTLLRRRFPGIPHLLTLQEYLPLCYRDGQLVRRGPETLCSGPSPAKCHGCFQHIPMAMFAAREVWIKSNLTAIDRFIAPSEFLAEKYVAWGIERAKIEILDYGRSLERVAPHRPLKPGQRRNRFAYFGQITPYKGLPVLLRAAIRLPALTRQPWTLDIYGNLNGKGFPELVRDFNKLLRAARARVFYHGAYDLNDLPRLIEPVDWVIIPSTWWENSPLVIREAFGHRRPVIVSDAGGMAEKVRHGVDGLRFPLGDSASLADIMALVLEDQSWWPRLVGNIQPPLGLPEYATRHRTIYEELSRKISKGRS